MIKVGITGGIGSGKTVVSDIFRLLGVPVFIADTESWKLINEDINIRTLLTRHFGDGIYGNNGKLEKTKLSNIIFQNKKALEQVNSIVHPFVKKKFNEWIKQYRDKEYVIKESALLFESGSGMELDKIITVYAPEALRIKRIIDRDSLPEKNIKAIIKNQISEEEKIKLSDFVVYNDEKQKVIPQVLKLDKIFRSEKL